MRSEITDVNRAYMERGKLTVRGHGIAGSPGPDTGTHASLVEASHFVRDARNSGRVLRIACPEEIALRLGYIDRWTNFISLP